MYSLDYTTSVRAFMYDLKTKHSAKFFNQGLLHLLSATPFRGHHSESSASISPQPLPLQLSHQLSPTPLSQHPQIFSGVLLFSSKVIM